MTGRLSLCQARLDLGLLWPAAEPHLCRFRQTTCCIHDMMEISMNWEPRERRNFLLHIFTQFLPLRLYMCAVIIHHAPCASTRNKGQPFKLLPWADARSFHARGCPTLACVLCVPPRRQTPSSRFLCAAPQLHHGFLSVASQTGRSLLVSDFPVSL